MGLILNEAIVATIGRALYSALLTLEEIIMNKLIIVGILSASFALSGAVQKDVYAQESHEASITNICKNGGCMPKGAVVSFELMSCPKGWKPYERSFGRFIRGIDPDGERVVASLQSDTFKRHSHKANMEIGAEPISGKAQASEAAGAHGRAGTMYTSSGLIQAVGGSETRPKNVGLLYCIKK